MTDFRVVVAQNGDTFCKMIRENLNLGFKMVNSNMTIRSVTVTNNMENLTNFVKGSKDATIREFYAYMEKEV